MTRFGNVLFGAIDVHVIPDEYERVQIRFPRSKRKRIRKKWRRDPANWTRRLVRRAFKFNERLFVDRMTYQGLMQQGPPLLVDV